MNAVKSYTNTFLPIVFLVIGMGSGIGMETGEGSWYQSLVKPNFMPPNWIFGPVWSVLYILMGISFSKIIQTKNKLAINLFIIQSIMNFGWSIIFFRMKMPESALIDIILMVILNIWIVLINRKNKQIVLMMLPYLLWISFATVLNSSICLLN
jgi:translocator protein